MIRLKHLFSHLTPAPCISIIIPPFKPTTFDQYKIRLATPTDRDSIFELCKDLYGGNDYVHVTFHRLIKNPKILFFVCEYETLIFKRLISVMAE